MREEATAMAGQDTPPMVRRRFAQGDSSVTPDTDAKGDAGGDAVSGASVASVSAAALTSLSPAARAGVAVKRAGTAALEAARELWLHPDRLLYVMWHGKPESMAEHRAYMKSRAWVPPGMDGKPEKAVIGAGLFYHLIIGRPLLAVANTFGAAAVRPLRLLCLIAFVVLLVVLLPL